MDATIKSFRLTAILIFAPLEESRIKEDSRNNLAL
jgi:hypothetical protein